MERKLILRGLLSGLIAGVLAFVFARIFAEPVIGQAIAYESARDAAQDALDRAAGLTVPAAEPEVFSRAIQSSIGAGAGIVVFAVAVGGLYAVAFSIAYGRVGLVRARTLALLIGLAGFLTFYLVPFLKYPANPPAIGHPATIGARSGLYLIMVGSSVLVAAAATLLGRRLRRRYSLWTSTLLAAGAFVLVMGVLMGLLPSFGELSANVAGYGRQATETPLPLSNADGAIVFPGFPADVLYAFRFYSVGAQVILWTTIGLVFATLAPRVLEPAQAAASTQSPQKIGSSASR